MHKPLNIPPPPAFVPPNSQPTKAAVEPPEITDLERVNARWDAQEKAQWGINATCLNILRWMTNTGQRITVDGLTVKPTLAGNAIGIHEDVGAAESERPILELNLPTMPYAIADLLKLGLVEECQPYGEGQ